MESKKFIPAALVAFIVVFIFDYLWFGVIFRDWWQTTMGAMVKTFPEKPNIPLHAFADLCFGLLLAWIYPVGYKGGSAMNEGLKFGLMMGLVLELPASIHMHDLFQSSELLCFNIIHGILVGMVGGVCVAMMYNRKSVASA